MSPPTSDTSAIDIEDKTPTSAASDLKKGTAAAGSSKIWIGLIIVVALSGGLVGGLVGGLSGGQSPGGWIQGTWVSSFGTPPTTMTITDKHWYEVSSWGKTVYTIDSNDGAFTVMQNPADASWNPSKWTKAEYHKNDGGGWGYCMSVYDAETAEAARTKDTATLGLYDKEDKLKGCGGKFGHTDVTKYDFPLLGTWKTDYGATITVTPTEWKSVASYGTSVHKIEAYGDSWVIMQNPADDSYNPSLWTKTEFHKQGNGFGFCSTVFKGATSVAALTTDTSKIYNATDAKKGCGESGFSHTVITKA